MSEQTAPSTAVDEHAHHGYVTRKDDYLKRLRRIEGQARGIQRMVDEEKYCIDILTQISAMTKAVQMVAMGLLEEHIKHCVVGAAGGPDAAAKLTEATGAIGRLIRLGDVDPAGGAVDGAGAQVPAANSGTPGSHPGYASRKDDYLGRLRGIEDQARGIQRMVDEEKYCIDILTQISAMTKALQMVAMGLLEDHIGHCVVDAAAAGGPEAEAKLKEATDAIARLVRS